MKSMKSYTSDLRHRIALAIANRPDIVAVGELLHDADRQARHGNVALAQEGLRRALLALPDISDGKSTEACRNWILAAIGGP